ncbi:hypothetical protein [Conexibacter sp. DBS9H8]|uniref:hypothetical protein n=1 Tax=Conexibacter sp. DBS9H8 TaxID=2937801 RepID=UPI00200D8998|nr:hypothetical protein [Conexibacter sp. DBS9H8]
MLVAVTDHAVSRYRQRVRGSLEERAEIIARVRAAHAAGRVVPAPRGAVAVRDLQDRDLIFICRPGRDELVVITLWEEGDGPAVPRAFTDALAPTDATVEPGGRGGGRGR